jgi:hypothetical protein
MSEFTSSGQTNGGIGPKTFNPYIPPTKSDQPLTPTSITLLSPPNLTKNDSKGD